MKKIKFITLLTLLTLFLAGQSGFCANNSVLSKYKNASKATKVQAISNLKKQQAAAHSKAQNLRVLEKVESNKLYKNQKKLETNRSVLITTQNEYNKSQYRVFLISVHNSSSSLPFLYFLCFA